MTNVSIYKKAGSIVRIELRGHSGYAPEGEDIVCAAVTSAVRYAEVLLNSILKLGVPFETDPETAFLSFSCPSQFPADGKQIGCGEIFLGFAQYMRQLSVEYPNYMKVMEVQHNA